MPSPELRPTPPNPHTQPSTIPSSALPDRIPTIPARPGEQQAASIRKDVAVPEIPARPRDVLARNTESTSDSAVPTVSSRTTGVAERSEAATPAEDRDHRLPEVTLPPVDSQGSAERPVAQQKNPGAEPERIGGAKGVPDQEVGKVQPSADVTTPPIKPPSSPPPTEVGGVPDDNEPVENMSDIERENTLTALERFVAGGQPFEETVPAGEGHPAYVEQGLHRNVPKKALEAEELQNCNVSVAIVNDPYRVGFNLSSRDTVEVDTPSEEPDVIVRRAFQREVSKKLVFTQESVPGVEPTITMESYTSEITLSTQIVPRADGEGGLQLGFVNKDNPLTLGETRAIMRAIGNAHRYVDESLPENAPLLAAEATLGRTDFTDVEIPEGGAVYQDVSPHARAAFMIEIDKFARSGKKRKGVGHYEREIPEAILQAQGINGRVKTVINEGFQATTDYYVGVSIDEWTKGVIQIDGKMVHSDVVREGFLYVFTQTGPKTFRSTQRPPIDAAAGEGYHLEYVGHDANPFKEGLLLAPDITYDQVRRLFYALREANRQREEGSLD